MKKNKQFNAKPYIIIGALVFILDLASKFYIDKIMDLGDSFKIIDNFFHITYIHNPGAAWGLLSGQLPIFVGISVIAAILMVWYFKDTTPSQVIARLGIALVFGGMLGNLTDRILFGYVRDFLDFFIFGYDYPVFNIADIGVVVGFVLLLLDMILGEFIYD